MRFVALALALAALLESPAAEACAAPHLVDVALTADGATLLDDGGVVIETRNGGAQAGGELMLAPQRRTRRGRPASATELDPTLDRATTRGCYAG